MAKKERKLVDKYAQEQMGDIKTAVGGTVAEAQSQLPGAKARAEESGGRASTAAGELALGTANPYATKLAVTGGISEDEAQAMETAATRGVRSVYDVLGAELQRKQAITGGYGGGGETARMARQAGQVAAEAGTDARARIAALRQGGRVAGAGLYSQDRIAGAQLLTQQYGLNLDQSNAVMDMILKAQATGIQLTQNDIAFLAEMSKQKSGFGAVAEGIGQVAGGVGGLIGGIGAL